MYSNKQKLFETQPLLEDHVETTQERRERQLALKYLYFSIALTTCIVIFGAGVIVGINFLGDYG